MSQSIFTNTLIASAGRVVNVGLGIVATALITRLLGPDGFGTYILLISVGTIIQLVADFGLYLTLAKEIARRSDVVPYIFSLRLTLLISVFLIATVFTLYVPSLAGFTLAFIILAIGLTFQSISQLLMSIYQHRQVVWRATIGDLIGRGVQIIGILIISSRLASVSTMAAMFTAGAGIALVFHRYLLPKTTRTLAWSWPIWKKIIRSSWPLGAMLLVNAIYFRIDTLILSLFRTPTEVGWYGLAYRIVESTLFFPAMFGGLILPRLTRAIAKSQWGIVSRYINQGLILLLTVGSLAVIVLVAKSRSIILLIAGPDFVNATPYLQLLGLAVIIIYCGNLFGFTLVALERQKFLLKLYGGLAIFNLITNLLFIPKYGALAAVWTTIATELLASTIAAYVVYRSVKWQLPPTIIIRLIALVVVTYSVALILPAAMNIIIQLICITAVFFSLATLLQLLTKKNLALLVMSPNH